ncbi:MAG: histidinol-phosphate transaminase [Chloroflexota bacterium]
MEPIKSYPRQSTRIDMDAIQAETAADQVYRMNFNESPLGPSPKVVAAIRMASAGIGSYPPMGDERMREVMAQVYGRGLTPDHFYTSLSGYEAIELVARTFLRPDDEMIICHPTFGVYSKVAALELATTVDVPLTVPDFLPDVDAILAAINPKTRAILLCNPNNPTGTMMPSADFDRLVVNLPDDVLIIADDVYNHFVTDPDYPDVIKHILDGKNIVRIQTFSKAYGMAGLRMGFGIAKPELANAIAGLHRGFHQNRVNMSAGVAALLDQEHLKTNVKAALDGKHYIYEQLDRLDLAYIPSQTNFLVVDVGRPVDDLVLFLKKEHGVLIKGQSLPGIEHGIRVSTTIQAGNEAFIAGMEAWLKG